MEDNDLIEAIRRRARDPQKRTDMAGVSDALAVPPCSSDAVADAERRLGFALYPLHRRLFEEVGNGGFGPGYGLFGLPGGHTDSDGRSLLELRCCLGEDEEHPELPHGVVPLSEFGCGIWTCIDSLTDDGRVLVLDECGLTDTGMSFRSWLADWLNGVDLGKEMFHPGEQKQGINPFTRQPMTFTAAGRAKGTPYQRR